MRRAQLFPVTLCWRALAVALVLAGTAGVAIGRAAGREGAADTWQWGANGGDVRAGLKQQDFAAAAAAAADRASADRASADRASADHASADRASADRASVGDAAAGNAAENTREETAAASSTGGSDRAVHRVLAAGSAVEAASPSLPLPSPTLPSPLLEQPVQQASSLPPECRDGSAAAAVTVETVRYDFLFPVSTLFIELYPYEVILSNTCGQRAIAALSISMQGVDQRSYLLMPRLLPTQRDSLQAITIYKVLPPLGAPDGAMIIPPGGSFKFTSTVVPSLALSISVYSATFSPLQL
ncbi:unnamed protein product [Closterium sp. Yama58-4]|nr:unnamed protein product [Closterium sp. Yama58-4]